MQAASHIDEALTYGSLLHCDFHTGLHSTSRRDPNKVKKGDQLLLYLRNL